MKLETKEVSDGLHDGKTVWICDYRWLDFDKKEDRKVEPKQVLIRSKDETNKRINYSHSFFSEIKKGKVVNSSLIKLFDNTGYRWYSGVALNVFTEEKECRDYYKIQANLVAKLFDSYKQNKLQRLDKISNEIITLL